MLHEALGQWQRCGWPSFWLQNVDIQRDGFQISGTVLTSRPIFGIIDSTT
jgi:hypothetical protein